MSEQGCRGELMNDFELQPLRIPGGWNVEWNSFSEADPVPENRDFFMGSTLFYAQNPNLLRAIDLCWNPERDVENGRFLLRVINLEEEWNESSGEFTYSGDWQKPHLTFESKSRPEIVKKMESLFQTLKPCKDPRILKKRGVVDAEAENMRLQLNDHGLSEELFQQIFESRNKTLQSLLIDHADVTSEMLNLLIESEKTVTSVKNKARQKLNSKAFRQQK